MKAYIKAYDLNVLLRLANLIVCGIIIALYVKMGADSSLVDFFTIVLAVIFAIENIGMLSYEKRKRNPFIIILVFVTTVFYLLRIATIIHIPESALYYGIVSDFGAENMNNAMLFILLANGAMFLGFCLGAAGKSIARRRVPDTGAGPRLFAPAVIFVIVILASYSDVLGSAVLGGRMTGYIQNFLNRYTIFLFTFTMLAFYYDRISKRLKVLLAGIVLTFVLLITLGGSRSAILWVFIIFTIGLLAIQQRMRISRKLTAVALVFIPVAVIFFITATFKQQMGIKESVTLEHVYQAREQEIFDEEHIQSYLSILYFRIGFLDYSSELIAASDIYKRIINIPYYIDSVVDNVLSPGFDVFGVSKVSNVLSYIRRGDPLPDREQVQQAYQSDQLGIYGEYYVLFQGYLSLAVFFITAFVFQRIYVRFKYDTVRSSIYRAVVLYLFYTWLNSFGMDWFLFDLITILITMSLFSRFYVQKRTRKAPAHNNACPAAGTADCAVS
ncbi:hypothetical protein ACFL43_00235 [Thermodesulfobacteriota bacterium]